MTQRLITEKEFDELVLLYENYICSLTESTELQDYDYLYNKVRGFLEGYLVALNYNLTIKQVELLITIREEIIGKDEDF